MQRRERSSSDGDGLLMLHPDYADQMSQMKHLCKVCEEPAAGFHFGAFTCEGCKSFFGRCAESVESPRVSLPPCKNEGRCSVLGRARTNCKQCRYDKCKRVGMSRERSRFGRRSHYFKVHELIKSKEEEECFGRSEIRSASPGDGGKVPIHKPLAIIPPPSSLSFIPQPSPPGLLTPRDFHQPHKLPFPTPHQLALLFPHLSQMWAQPPPPKMRRLEEQAEPLDLSKKPPTDLTPLDLSRK